MKALARYRWTVLALIVIGAVAAIRWSSHSDITQRDGLTYASPALARSLERSASSPGTRVLEQFADAEGVPCRAFLASQVSGIACKESGGWHLRVIRAGVSLDDPASVAATERDLRGAAGRMKGQ